MSVWAASACRKSTRSESGRANIHAAVLHGSPSRFIFWFTCISQLPPLFHALREASSRLSFPHAQTDQGTLGLDKLRRVVPTQLLSRFDLHVHGPTVADRHSLSLSLAFLPTRVIFADGRACVIYLGCL